jgi:hypothetical protein
VDHTEDFDRYRHLSACSTCQMAGPLPCPTCHPNSIESARAVRCQKATPDPRTEPERLNLAPA